jgi:prophage regulatory protein
MSKTSRVSAVASGVPVRILRRRQVLAQTGLAVSTLYEYMARGGFPRPIHLGRNCVGWLDSEINAWIAERIAESRTVEAQP